MAASSLSVTESMDLALSSAEVEKSSSILTGYWGRPCQNQPTQSYLEIGNIDSTITGVDILKMRNEFWLPRSVKMFPPYPDECLHSPQEGSIGIFKYSLAFRLRFPLPRILTEYNRDWGLEFIQTHPNIWARIISLLVLCRWLVIFVEKEGARAVPAFSESLVVKLQLLLELRVPGRHWKKLGTNDFLRSSGLCSPPNSFDHQVGR
ncbi:ERD (early-responsive to dehydration stress)family protein [Striga asiatica]|uniref:ERD (Early-responsive to dehydration stress)family protein n=1 Tax=Striga asiatica TaxID=4170 RepID=A0A5A7NXZ5_STRAF|nr:ERD (early-responsive to dehydration stress)family protein [Striga asiatica]